MDREDNSIILQNEKEANKIIARVMRICAIALTLILVLNIIGIFIIDMKAMVIAYVVGMIILLLPTFMVNIFKLYSPTFKFIFVTIAALFVSVLIITLNWHAIVMFIFAIAIANMYFSKSLNIYAVCISLVTFSVSQYFAYILNFTTDRNEQSLYDLFVYCIGPRALALLAVSAIFIALNGRTRKLLSNLLDADAQERMMRQMQAMQEKSALVSKNLADTVDTLSSVTDNTSKNNKDISSRAEMASQASNETLMHIDEASDNILNISENLSMLSEGTGEIAHLSADVKRLTELNTNQMDMAMEGFDKISEATNVSKQVISDLENKSHEIAQITDVITSISTQTNLLALNASIESARAGEAGRGFAVVAEQIRQLAEQTKNAVSDISLIVSEVTANTMEAVNTMDESSRLVTDGMSILESAEQSTKEVTDASEKMNEKIGEIDSLTKTVADYSERIVDIFESVKSISSDSLSQLEGVANLSEEGLSDMEELENLVTKINEMSKQLLEVVE